MYYKKLEEVNKRKIKYYYHVTDNKIINKDEYAEKKTDKCIYNKKYYLYGRIIIMKDILCNLSKNSFEFNNIVQYPINKVIEIYLYSIQNKSLFTDLPNDMVYIISQYIDYKT